MAETLELQQVICPSCKQVITSFNPFEAEVECPYCHNKAFNPLITAKKVPVPERVITFQTSEMDFERAMIDSLVERDYVPTDVFQHIHPENIIKAYLPMFLYEGRYSANWSCAAAPITSKTRGGILRTLRIINFIVNKKWEEKFQSYNGTASGNFAALCLAYDGRDIPKELREFCEQYHYNLMASKEYNPDLLGLKSGHSPLTLALDADTDVTWGKQGSSIVTQFAEQNALDEQLAGYEIRGFKTFNCSSNLNHNGRYVLAPFWFVYYTYNKEKHYFIMDGVGDRTAMSAPVCQEEVKSIKSLESIKKITSLWWLVAILILVIASACNVPVQHIFLWTFMLSWMGAKLIRKILDKQIVKKLENSKELRREAANKLG